MRSFKKILIANRGEIAVRIIRAAKKLGIRSVSIYAADDANSLHVSMADEAISLVGNTLAETYLNQEKIIQIALSSGVDAIHPGYGFLSENAGFAQNVSDAGLVFIGPTPENIRLMGEKNRALNYVESLGIPILKSFRGSINEILRHTAEMSFPILVKASGGGGGKGMVICDSADELATSLEKAERQALSYFGNGELFVEQYLPQARHIEVQLLADSHGNVLHFYERECSVQRRFQKIIEEAPSPSVDEKLREELTSAAVKIARSMNYRNAGTIEFLLDENGKYYFLEMNTRIQVEHPVTEMVTNTDLVALQIHVAAGNSLNIRQEDVKISGHAIEVRLCAEDAENKFQPSAGNMDIWQIPEEEYLRVETFVEEDSTISPNYDSLLAKLIVWNKNRDLAIESMSKVLNRAAISGVHTNLPFLSGLIDSKEFIGNRIFTNYIDSNLKAINLQIQLKKERVDKQILVFAYLIFRLQQKSGSGNSVWNQIGFWRLFTQFEVVVEDEVFNGVIESNVKSFLISIGNHKHCVLVGQKGKNSLDIQIGGEKKLFYFIESKEETTVVSGVYPFRVRSNLFINEVKLNNKKETSGELFQNLICADLFGKVLKLNISEGDVIQSGEILLTLESMKTEIHVLCPANSRVKKVHVKVGNTVIEKQLLVELAPSDSPKGGEEENPNIFGRKFKV